MRPYLVWTTDYRHHAGGEKVLHRLCHELNLVGQEAYVSAAVTNPEWQTPHADPPLDGDDWIAVYPEVVSSNPFGAPHVARWVLNVPGKLGGDTAYDPAEVVFSWSRAFLDAPILHLPAIETDIYVDRHLPRRGRLYYVGKGARRKMRTATEITKAMRADRAKLADALNRAAVLYCFDEQTAMTQIARLCGCPVVIVPTRERLEPDGFAAEYQALVEAFPAQLAAFIRMTQACGTIS